MSEEESFVILGSSPLPSLCSHGNSLLHDALDAHEDELQHDGDKPNESESVAASAILIQQSNIPDLTKEQKQESSLPTTLPSEQNSLAASFLMGDVNPDVLKVCMQNVHNGLT